MSLSFLILPSCGAFGLPTPGPFVYPSIITLVHLPGIPLKHG
jgi:hypothetical protein